MPSTHNYGLLYRFFLEINGIVEAEFNEVSGLTVEREVKQVREGGINDYVTVLPGRVKFNNITLKRGLAYSSYVWDWFQEGLYDAKVKRQTVSLTEKALDNRTIRQWDIHKAFPVKYTTSEFKTGQSALVIETLELAHHGVTLTKQAA
jgi:phage tail-like protein